MIKFIRDVLFLIVFFLLLCALWGDDLQIKNTVYKNVEILTVTDKTVTITHDEGAVKLEVKDLPEKWKQYIIDHKDEFKVKPDIITDIKEYREVKDGSTYKEPPLPTKPKAAPIKDNEQVLNLKENVKRLENEIKTLKKKLSNTSNSLDKENINSEIKDNEWFLLVVRKRLEILTKNN